VRLCIRSAFIPSRREKRVTTERVATAMAVIDRTLRRRLRPILRHARVVILMIRS